LKDAAVEEKTAEGLGQQISQDGRFYQLISACYVDGWMFGEVKSEETRATRPIYLV
jgi:hypothetical protein